ncbi:MAG: hypothetical protein DRP13_02285 [Candidatus Aenigmatarchaeota archaeon]|nr:MAG: hypothetical protein DRP13_02285 [Candidatus Aenigmarchaeota archaeon]
MSKLNRREFLRNSLILTVCGFVFPDEVLGRKKPYSRCFRVIYPTIDDGPTEWTEYITNEANKNGSVTLFCIGERLRRYRDYAVRAIENGNVIGNHSYHHPHFSEISFEQAKREIEFTDREIRKTYRIAQVSRYPKLFRFPYSDRGFREIEKHGRTVRKGSPEKKYKIEEFLRDMGYKTCGWDVDTRDWDSHTPLLYILRTLDEVNQGDIILLHERKRTAYHILPYLVKKAKRKGYGFRTLA